MKPIQLSMTAFGPYRDKEVIDFTQLEDHKLYVISGATGAGKTTIFDGICFALYGSASGSDRDNITMLRSHFADDDIHTSVELIFSLKGKTYRVLRQLGHVKKGNRSKTGERYELYEVLEDNQELPCVDRQIVSEINEKLEQLLGLTQDQFKQIVMLPQGEFRKLLTSDTENKEAILRRLFQTVKYQQLNTLLKGKKEIVQQRFTSEKQLLDYHIQSVHTLLEKREQSLLFKVLAQESFNVEQVLEGLHEEAVFYDEKTAIDKKAYIHTLQQYERTQKHLHQSVAVNEQFDVLDKKKQALQQLNDQKEVYSQKEAQLNAAERASHIEAYEQQMIDRKKELHARKQHVYHAEKQVEDTKETLHKVKKAYVEEENKQGLREQIGRDIEQLYDFLPVVKEMDEKKQQIDELQLSIQRISEEVDVVKKQMKEKMGKIENYKKSVQELGNVDRQLGVEQVRRNELATKYKVLADYMKEKKQQDSLFIELKTKKNAYIKVNTAYEKMEKDWLQSQAAFLASHLQHGEACPVCGSEHHPNKASLHDHTTSKKELDEQKEKVEEKYKAYYQVQGKYTVLSDQVKNKAEEVKQFGIELDQVEHEKNNIVVEGKRVSEGIQQLNAQVEELEKIKKELEQLEKAMMLDTTKKESLEQELLKQNTTLSSLDATFKERTRRIPKEFQQLTRLQKQIQEQESRKNVLEKKWNLVKEQLKSAEHAYTTAEVTLANGRKELSEAKVSVEKAEGVFQQQLKQAQFTNADSYVEAKMTENERQKLAEEIKQYTQQTTMLEKQISEMKETLKDRERVDVSVIEQTLRTLKEAYESALEQMNRSRKYYEVASQLKDDMESVQENVAELEKALATVTDLFDVLRGQNTKKISFERYLQIDYLDQITSAANERFQSLTNGQYYLTRSDRQEAYGKQSGLAIDVYDSYTGQTRDVKTLSGGEKFIASLSLALGMSDVIQSFQGNIVMETMFIDEGFGSLDEESLNKSIDALVHLQKTGRIIGVISHVQELKNIFPARLEVKKTQEGYSKTEIVIK